MAWIELHQSLREHPKLKRLARSLNLRRSHAAGVVAFLFLWCLDYAKDGDLSRYDVADIAEASDWDDDPAALVDALVAAGFLDRSDGGIAIHDWSDYAGRLLEKRATDAQRKRDTRSRTSIGRPSDVQRTAQVPNQPNQHDHTHHGEGAREEASPPEEPAPARDSLQMPKGEPLGDALHPDKLFPGEIEILEAEFLGPRIKAFWQLTSGDRAKILNWLEFPKEDRRRAWNFAVGEEWAKAKFSVAYGALTQPGKYPKFNPNVVQLRPVAAERPPSPFVGKPWASIWAPEMKGTVSDRDYMWRQARRAHDLGGGTCDVDHAMETFAASGVEAAMDYVWSCYAQNKARGHAAG